MNFKEYYLLTKPGIIRGNLITAVAAFLFASQGSFNFEVFAALTIGVVGIIGSGCVFNNYVDRHIDAKMPRTKKRAFVTGVVSPTPALVFGTVLGLFGFLSLLLFVNTLTAVIGLVGLGMYVIAYGVAKRKTVHGTLVGTIPGATPPLAGYVAVTGSIDITATILFLILVFWQMPHFYAIAMYRLKDYKAAGIPVLPAVKGLRVTKIQILLYIIGFLFATQSLALLSYAGLPYALIMGAMALFWLFLGVKGFNQPDDVIWAKKMFGFSLVTLLVFSIMISLNYYLP